MEAKIMGTFKFACKMLKREKKQAISYGVTVLFTVFVSFVFFNIINNDYLMDQTAAASGGSFHRSVFHYQVLSHLSL